MSEVKSKGKHKREFVGFNLEGWSECGEDNINVLFVNQKGQLRGINKEYR